jgi:hypothetical protein
MALIIKPKGTNTIEIPGADIQLVDLYVRIEFAGRADGKSIEFAPMGYKSKAKFIEGKPLPTNIQMQTLQVEIDTAVESQSIETAHKYAKLYFEQLGYDVIVDLQSSGNE